MGGVVAGLLEDVEIPKMFKVKQLFHKGRIECRDIPAALRDKLEEKKAGNAIKPGMRIAITAGSRGIANVDVITRSIVDYVREKGGEPFVGAAMEAPRQRARGKFLRSLELQKKRWDARLKRIWRFGLSEKIRRERR